MLKEKGFHSTDKGKKIIDQVLCQMNNDRLSTALKPSPNKEWSVLQLEIDNLLSGPSNYEVKKDGRIFIISENRFLPMRTRIWMEHHDENGNIINTFGSLAHCVKFKKKKNLVELLIMLCWKINQFY